MRPQRTLLALLSVASLGLSSSVHAAPSFDCGKASTPVERAVCGNADLGDLDARLAAALKDALSRAGADRDDLLRQQRAWLTARNTCTQEHTPLKVTTCLQDRYTGRTNQLRLFKNSLARASIPLCRAFADRIETLYQNDPTIFAAADKSGWWGRTALEILAGDKASGLVLNNETESYSGSEDLLAAFTQAVRPASLSENAVAAIKDDYSDSPYLFHLPQTNLYVVGSVQGTAHCTVHTWFEVRGGHVEPLATSSPDDENGGTCGVAEDQLALFNNVPVRFASEWDARPSLTSSVDIGARVDGVWAPACSVHFDFAPKFDLQQSLNEGEKSCPVQDCSKLYDDALKLVVATQKRQGDGTDKLSPAAKDKFEKMQVLWRKDNPRPETEDAPATSQRPDDVLETDPLVLPSVVEDKVYLVTLGHRTIGWRIYSDWEVKFWSLAGDGVTNVATTTVGMARGKLLRVNIVEPAP